MNLSKYWDALKIMAAAQKYKYLPTAANWLALLKKFEPSNWEFEQNRVVDGRNLIQDSGKITPHYDYDNIKEAVSERKGVFEWSVGEGDKRRIYIAKSKFNNKPGQDELTITYANGTVEQMQNVSFDSDVIGFPPLFQFEARYQDAAGNEYYDRHYNQF